MKAPRFGIQRINRRYSTPNNFRGNKLSSQNMGRTMKLKFKKVQEIKTSRSQMQMYSLKKQMQEVEQQLQKQFFKTHSRVFRGGGYSSQKKGKIQANQLAIHPKRKQQKKEYKPKTFYYSSNLEQKMNLYMNNLINKSEEEHKQKLKEIQKKNQQDQVIRKTSYNTRTLFWKKMKKFISQKQKSLAKAKDDQLSGKKESFDLTSLATRPHTFRVTS